MFLFRDESAQQPISGDMSDPIRLLIGDGQHEDMQLFLRNPSAPLSAGIDADDTEITFEDAPYFEDGDFLIVGSEMLQVVSGGGTNTLTVQRGIGGTTPAEHLEGAIVWSGYDYQNVSVSPVDTAGDDESGWISIAEDQEGLDTATPGDPLDITEKSYDETVPLWVRVSVPDEHPSSVKQDLRLRVQGLRSAGAIS